MHAPVPSSRERVPSFTSSMPDCPLLPWFFHVLTERQPCRSKNTQLPVPRGPTSTGAQGRADADISTTHRTQPVDQGSLGIQTGHHEAQADERAGRGSLKQGFLCHLQRRAYVKTANRCACPHSWTTRGSAEATGTPCSDGFSAAVRGLKGEREAIRSMHPQGWADRMSSAQRATGLCKEGTRA